MKVEFQPRAKKQFARLDKAVQRRITRFFEEVEELADPRSRGKMLTGNWAGYWSYRIGDYRAICDIVDDKITIYVMEVGHRRDVYD